MSSAYSQQQANGLQVVAYRGIGTILLAWSLDQSLITDLAGFAIRRTAFRPLPDGQSKASSAFLPNRLTFTQPITGAATETESEQAFTSSDVAPFQVFRWLDASGTVGRSGRLVYEIVPKYFVASPGTALRNGNSVTINLTLTDGWPGFTVGFTSGFISSQAYLRQFKDDPAYRPDGPKTATFDWHPFDRKYAWLGSRARALLKKVLTQTLADPACTVSAFIYDCDMPELVEWATAMGPRLRVIVDNSTSHIEHTEKDVVKTPVEVDVVNRLRLAGVQLVQGHFLSLQHNKTLVISQNSQPVTVLTGSANYSIRGYYVQANSVLLIEDAPVAQAFQTYFDTAFALTLRDMTGPANPKAIADIKTQPVCQQWFDFTATAQLPAFSVCFAPHTSGKLSLGRVTAALKNAATSVLFAVMDVSGSGEVIKYLKSDVQQHPELLHYGIIDVLGKDAVTLDATQSLTTVTYAELKAAIGPFAREVAAREQGGIGHFIHHKFVVVDFDTPNAVVFTGSSNLAESKEQQNGDTLLAIRDPVIATAYALEALRHYDHFYFRQKVANATFDEPLVLQTTDAWSRPFYDTKAKDGPRKVKDRRFFARVTA